MPAEDTCPYVHQRDRNVSYCTRILSYDDGILFTTILELQVFQGLAAGNAMVLQGAAGCCNEDGPLRSMDGFVTAHTTSN